MVTRGIIAVGIYAVLWLTSWCILLLIGCCTAISHLLCPLREVPIGLNKPETIIARLQEVGINAYKCDGRVVVAARDAELAREWVLLID